MEIVNGSGSSARPKQLAVRVTRVVVELESSERVPEEHGALAMNAAFLQGLMHLVASTVAGKASISPVEEAGVPIVGAKKKYLVLFSA